MSQFRLVALAVIGAAGCYSPPPESTFPESPEQHYVSGPPGGAIDAEPMAPEQSAYDAPDAAVTFQGGQADQADPSDATDDDDLAGEPADLTGSSSAVVAPSVVAGPVGPDASDAYDSADGGAEVDAYGNTYGSVYDGDGELGASGVAEGPIADPSVAPTASVTDVEIDAALDGHGQWIETQDYGQVWRPDATVVGVDFTPYESAGSWAYTDTGWSFNCDYSWGWLPFHYGRWSWFGDYWGWVPGHRWAPSWVDWRHGNGVIGWRPAPPRIRDRGRVLHREYRYGRGNVVRDHRRAQVRDSHWRFASTSNFTRPRIRSHVFRDSAQGLRVTSRVSAPPLRARTSIRTGDLMRNRFSSVGRSGRFGGPVRTEIRDRRIAPPAQRIQRDARYQPYGPQRPYIPSQTARPQRGAYDRGPAPGRVQTYDRVPPNRVQTYPGRVAPPSGRPSQPVRVYPQSGRPSQPIRTYDRPSRGQPYVAPDRGRTYQAPARTFTPSAPARSSSPPARAYNPPARVSSPPSPSRSSSPSSSSSSRSSGGGSSHSSGRSSRR